MKGPESTLVCGQCHSVWAFNGMEAKLDWNRHGGKFRPGKEDLVQRFVVQPNEQDHPRRKISSGERSRIFIATASGETE